MNLQSLMKQAQSMQKNMMQSKSEIESKNFEGNTELVNVVMSGKKEIVSIKIKVENGLDQDDIEILEDMVVVAVNEAIHKINKEIEEKLGSQAAGMEGLL